MRRLNIESVCPECDRLNIIFNIKTLLQNKCRVCDSELYDKSLMYDIDIFMDEYFPQGTPDVVPFKCDDCDYFNITGWFDFGNGKRGYCEYYDEETFENWICIVTEIENGLNELEIEEGIDCIFCPSCNKEQNPEAIFCKDCGTEIYPKELATIAYCDKCESEFDESYQFCENDGNKLVLKEKEIDKSPQNIKSVKTSTNIVGEPQVSNDLDKDRVTDLPMNWYKFITYLLFPAGILGYLYLAALIGDDTVTVSLVFGALFGAVIIYGLHNKTSWSWKLLIISYILNSATFRIYRLEDVGLGVYIFGVIIINAIITYPNYIYFNKRKHLFNN